MCKSCADKFDLEKTRTIAIKWQIDLKENMVIYQNALGYNFVSEKCFKSVSGKLIETLIYEQN